MFTKEGVNKLAKVMKDGAPVFVGYVTDYYDMASGGSAITAFEAAPHVVLIHTGMPSLTAWASDCELLTKAEEERYMMVLRLLPMSEVIKHVFNGG